MRKENLQCPTMLHLQVNSYIHISGQHKSQTGIFHEGNVVGSTYKTRKSFIKFRKFLFKLNLNPLDPIVAIVHTHSFADCSNSAHPKFALSDALKVFNW